MKTQPSPVLVTVVAAAMLVMILPLPSAVAQAPKPSPTSALGEDVMYARLTQFFSLVSESKVKEAYAVLAKGSPNSEFRIPNSEFPTPLDARWGPR